MKWKLLFCAAVLAAAGCASDPQDTYTGYVNLGFHADMIPPPVEGLTAADLDTTSDSAVVSPPTANGQAN